MAPPGSGASRPPLAGRAHERGSVGSGLSALSDGSQGGAAAGSSSRAGAAPGRRRRGSLAERTRRGLRRVRRYVSRGRGVDKWAIAAWMLVDFCWCQEQEAGVLAAFLMFVFIVGKLFASHFFAADDSARRINPHEATHCVAVLLWASGNVSWMWMEFGQARERPASDYYGPGAPKDDWWRFRSFSLVAFATAFAVELAYFAWLRHTPLFENDWVSNPLTANLIARHQRRLSQASGGSDESRSSAGVGVRERASESGAVGGGGPGAGAGPGGGVSGAGRGGARWDPFHPARAKGPGGGFGPGTGTSATTGDGASSMLSSETSGGTGAGPGGGAARGHYGATERDPFLDPDIDHEMTTILPRFPQYFKTWDDYESVAIMIWIVKDFCWIFCTKFTHHFHDRVIQLGRWAWGVTTVALLLLHVDFFVASFTQTRDDVEWVNYFCLLLWACSQSLWAFGEIFLYESVIKREPVFEEPDDYGNLRWYAGWFAFAAVGTLYAYWIGKFLWGCLIDDWDAGEDGEGGDGAGKEGFALPTEGSSEALPTAEDKMKLAQALDDSASVMGQ